MTTTLTLYSFGPSHNAVRPELALLEKGVPFEKREVDLFQGEHQKAPLSDVTPRRQVPTLVYNDGDRDVVVYESVAILYFLEDMFPEPALMPPVSEPAERAKAHMRMAEFHAKLDPRNIFGSVVFRRQTRAQLGARVDDLLAEIGRWDAYVGHGPFLVGERFGLADITVFPLLIHFEVLGYDYGKHAPALAAYIERCKQRPCVQQSGWLERIGQLVERMKPDQVLSD